MRVSFGFVLLLLTGTAVAVGCGSTDGDEAVSPSPDAGADTSAPRAPVDAASAEDAAPDAPEIPSVPAAGVCTQLAQKTCAFLSTCSPETVEGLFAAPAECVPRFESICMAQYPVGAAVRKDDADALTACLGGLGCDDLYGPAWSTKCSIPRLTTAKAVGTACRIDAECMTGSCSGSSTQCGTCVKRLAAGAACTESAQCPQSGFCSTKCYAAAYLGDSCDTYNVCGNGLRCMTGTCVKAAGEGTTCNGDQDCDLAQLIECNGTTKQCQKVAFAQPGETCPDPFVGAPLRCVKGSHCIRPVVAQPGTCVAPQKVGEACDSSKKCESLINCRGGKCVLPTFVACP
ncbi:hypothetical protein BH11MYX4_BH11MYX4_18550 [soil metagenome]